MTGVVLFVGKCLVAWLLLRNWDDRAKRWAGFFVLFAAGFDVREFVQLQMEHTSAGSTAYQMLDALQIGLWYVCDLGLIYVLVPCGLAFEPVPGRRRQRHGLLLLMMVPPLLLMGAVWFGASIYFYEIARLLYACAAIFVAAAAMLVYTMRETNRKEKLMRLVGTLIMIPNMVISLLVRHGDYVPVFDSHRYEIGSATIVITVAVVFILAFRSGLLGFRLRFEREMMSQTYKAITTGTGMMNHAIKNRLQLIDMLGARIGEHAASTEQVKRDAEAIREEMNELMDVIDRIQHRVRDVQLVETVFPLQQLIEQVLISRQETAARLGAALIADKLPPVLIRGDWLHLQEALGNVVQNALDAVPLGSGRIVVSAVRRGRSLLIEVEDNGPGIASSELDRVFEPFYSSKNRTDSYGLGLAYAYSVMDGHGGSIAVRNRTEGGAVFTLRLPARRLSDITAG